MGYIPLWPTLFPYMAFNANHNDYGGFGTSKPKKNDDSDDDNRKERREQRRQERERNRQYHEQDYQRREDKKYAKELSSQKDLAYIRCLLHQNTGAKIIGKGGQDIKRLRNDHKLMVKVHNSKTLETTMEITSDRNGSDNKKALLACLTEIIRFVRDYLKSSSAEAGYVIEMQGKDDPVTELRLLVNRDKCGGIIGKGADTLKRLRLDHDVKIKVYAKFLGLVELSKSLASKNLAP